jgi:hypothetical protein
MRNAALQAARAHDEADSRAGNRALSVGASSSRGNKSGEGGNASPQASAGPVTALRIVSIPRPVRPNRKLAGQDIHPGGDRGITVTLNFLFDHLH